MTSGWLPPAIGVVASLLSLFYVAWCILAPPAVGDQIFLGYRMTGIAGWLASALNAAFFAWLAYAAFKRRRAASWGVIGYCVYLTENLWIFSTGQGSQYFPNTFQMILTNTVVTTAVLAFARFVLKRQADFPR